MKNKHPDLQLGIIGSGGRGQLLGSLAHRPGRGSRVVACCDVSESTLARNRADYGAGIFTTGDYRALLDRKLDAMIIATPDFLHEEQAVAVLRRQLLKLLHVREFGPQADFREVCLGFTLPDVICRWASSWRIRGFCAWEFLCLGAFVPRGFGAWWL